MGGRFRVIGGLLIDAMVIAAIVAFAWAGPQLGGLSTIGRLIESMAAFWIAALVRDPVGDVIQSVTGTSKDFSNLVGMLLVGTGVYIATNSLFRWWRGRRIARRLAAGFDELDADPLEGDHVARAAGGFLGFGWVLLFVAILVLMPVDSPVSRAAADSFTGGTQIQREGFLRWLNRGFPHYTQALPKGTIGAVVGEEDDLPMQGDARPKVQPRDADVLLRGINALRRSRKIPVLTFNPDVAAVARRHALALAAERTLSYESPSGGSLDPRVQAALGESSASFAEEIGIELVWSHGAGNAAKGLLASSRASSLLRDRKWSEIGIGVANAGWFNGRIYVLILIEPVDAADGIVSPSEGAAAAAGGGDQGSLSVEPTAVDPLTGEPVESGTSDPASTDACEPVDIDGDGVPDPESVDPTLADCADPQAPPTG